MVGLRAWARRLRVDELTVDDGTARDGMWSVDWQVNCEAFRGLWIGVCDTRVGVHGVMEMI